jgi:8-oxo-dGTP pyrophosphatase MutT (NUDIX family)
MSPPVEVAIAILHQADRFLMQLRDDDPRILYPGVWGLFGGHLEAGETPEAAVIREVWEEINYHLPQVEKFGVYQDTRVIRHVFYAPLRVGLSALSLQEGWDMGWVTLKDLQQGDCYSTQAQQTRPIGSVHQQILLAFAQQRACCQAEPSIHLAP